MRSKGLPEGQSYFQRSLEQQRDLGDKLGIGICLNNLAEVTALQSDFETANALYLEGLAIFQELKDRRCAAYALEGLAEVAAAQADYIRTIRLFAAALDLREQIGAPLPPASRDRIQARLAQARSACGDRVYLAEWEQGLRMMSEG